MVHENRFASTLWVDEAVTTLAVEPTLDDSYSSAQCHNLPPFSIAWRS
jgi:hypothetical protein